MLKDCLMSQQVLGERFNKKAFYQRNLYNKLIPFILIGSLIMYVCNMYIFAQH